MTTDEFMFTVQLLGVPLDLWERTAAHQEAIQREFDIMKAQLPDQSIPNRLLKLIEELDTRFGDFRDEARQRMATAMKRGASHTDLTYHVPRAAAQAARTVKVMLTEADNYCRAGEHLLTLATPADLVDFRNWVLDEFVRQIDEGQEARPWDPGVRGAGDPAAAAEPVRVGSAQTIQFEGDLDLATAGSLRDAIQRERAAGVGRLTVDLRKVGFMDSVGISLLVATHKRLLEEGVEMRLIVPKRLYALLALTGLTEVLKPEEAPAVSNG